MSKGDKMFRVGNVFNTHGLKGEVKVKRISDFEERFHKGNKLYYKDEKGQFQELLVSGFRTQKETYLLSFKGISHINDVLFLKGATLYIEEEQLTDLEEREYYYHQIIGCTMFTTTGEMLGKVETILSPGANDVWVVKGEENKEILIPYIDSVVKQVDVEEKKIIIEVMEGLLD